ncbi:MAG: DsbE family thiol:disulfide interchange protein [Pseudomonadota bacterium]
MTEQTETPAPKTGFRPWMAIPALGAAAVLAVFMLGLQRDDIQRLPSTLIDKPVPEFALAPLDPEKPGLSTADTKTPGVKLINIWASWCGPCRIEHPHLMDLAADGVTIHGINYKDAPENASAFLVELGDPYNLVGTDNNGRAGIEFGVYGVPETFVIDGDGVIVYKHVGPIVGDDVEKKILPAIEAARAGG